MCSAIHCSSASTSAQLRLHRGKLAPHTVIHEKKVYALPAVLPAMLHDSTEQRPHLQFTLLVLDCWHLRFLKSKDLADHLAPHMVMFDEVIVLTARRRNCGHCGLWCPEWLLGTNPADQLAPHMVMIDEVSVPLHSKTSPQVPRVNMFCYVYTL
jgi:hypothetical protein